MPKVIPASKLMDYKKLLDEIDRHQYCFIVEREGRRIAAIIPYGIREKKVRKLD